MKQKSYYLPYSIKKNIYLHIDNRFQEHDMKAGHSIRKEVFNMTNPFIYRKLSVLFLLFITFGNVYSKNKEMEQLFPDWIPY